MICFNKLLHDKRIEKGLSLKEASKQLKIPKFLIGKYENGYYKPSKKNLKKLVDFYGIDESLITEQSFLYFEPVEVQPPKKPVANKKKINIILSVALAVLIALSVVSGVFYAGTKENPLQHYAPEYQTMVHALFSASKKTVAESVAETASSSEEEPQTIGELILETFMSMMTEGRIYEYNVGKGTVKIESGKSENFSICNTYSYYETIETEYTLSLDLYQIMKDKTLTCDFLYTTADKDSAKTISRSFDFGLDGNYHVDPATYELTEEQAQFCENNIYQAVSNINTAFKEGLNVNIDLNSVSIYQANGYTKYTTWYFTLFFFVALSPCLAILCLYLLLQINFIEKFSKNCVDNTTYITGEGKPLPTVCKVRPFLHEKTIKIVGLIALFLASATAYIDYIYGQHMISWLSAIQNLKEITLRIRYLLPVAIGLLFFIKIDISIRKKNLPQTVLMFLFLGIWYYYGMYILATHFNITRVLVLAKIIRRYLPGNFFFGLGAIASIPMFMFTTPKSFLDKKWKVGIWRGLTAIPILYLVFSNFVSPFLDLPTVSQFVLYPKSIIPTVFGVTYILILYIQKTRVINTYKSNAEQYFNGKKYMLNKNLLTILSIAILCVIDVLLGLIPEISVLGFGKSWGLAVIIPLVLFYHPRIEKRSPVGDIVYVALYGLCFCCSYIAFVLEFAIRFKGLLFAVINVYVFLMNIIR